MTREDLEQRLRNLEEAEHEAIFSLGRATGMKDAVRQILADFLAEGEGNEKDRTEQ
jgi:hypothetical protein